MQGKRPTLERDYSLHGPDSPLIEKTQPVRIAVDGFFLFL